MGSFQRWAGKIRVLVLFAVGLGPPVVFASSGFGPPERIAPVLPHRLTVGDGFALFQDNNSGFGARLWRTDGTAAGTAPLLPESVGVIQLFRFGPWIWFEALDAETGERALWRSDGTAAGTFPVAHGVSLTHPLGFHPGQGLAYFGLRRAQFGPDELWVSDGSPEGTRPLGSPFPAEPAELVTLPGPEAFFLAPIDGRVGLWATDGSPEGTRPVQAPPDGEFAGLLAAGDLLYLGLAREETGGRGELWASDGTAGGTRLVHDFGTPLPCCCLGPAEPFCPVPAELVGGFPDGRALVVADTEEVPRSLWVVDGAAAEPIRLVEIDREETSDLVEVAGVWYFTTEGDLWRTDGTPAGTRVAVELCPGPWCGAFLSGPAAAGQLELLQAEPPLGREPLLTDGTPEGTVALGDLCPGPCGSNSHAWLDAGGVIVFRAAPRADFQFQLWATDLTAAGTRQLTHLGSVEPRQLARVGDRIVFGATSEAGEAGLWALALPALPPLPPPGPWLSSPGLPGFEVKVAIHSGPTPLAGTLEPTCAPETLCVSGARPGRPALFVQVIGPRGNGFLWPLLAKTTPSAVEVWLRRTGPGPEPEVRYYHLAATPRRSDELDGRIDRTGFRPDPR